MKKANKGFTIVELVIVIAVIAILAAVLIPTFTSIIEKANLSKDQQAVSNMNKELAIEFATKKPVYAGDAIQTLYALGYNEGKLVPYAEGYHYVYDLSENRFYLTDENDKIVYPEEKTDKGDMWAIYFDAGEADKIEDVSNYVFLKSPQNHYDFASAFANGTYTLDLNQCVLCFSTEYVATISEDSSESSIPSNDRNITVVNGYTTVETYAVAEENDVSNKTLAATDLNVYDKNMVKNDGTLTFDGYSFVGEGLDVTLETTYTKVVSKINNGFDGALSSGTSVTPVTKLEFKNCVFADYKQFTPFGAETKEKLETNQAASTIIEVVFDNCTFVNAGTAISCNTRSNTTRIQVTNCEFINCSSGIHIRAPKVGSVISNNIFNITGSGSTEGHVVQFYSDPVSNGDTTPLVTISNNTVECAESIVYLNSISGMESDDWAKFVKFENNSYPAGVTKVTSDSSSKAHIAAVENLVK